MEINYPKGMKWTKQRKAQYQILYEATEPLSAPQLYALVQQKEQENYALSTIYRILAAFEEQNLVNKNAWMGEDTYCYELNRGGHTHYAVCLDCHKRIPLEHCPFAHLHLEEETEDFTITSHKIELYGYCKACKVQHTFDGKTP